ncbi:hypothetical protein OG361_39990 [Streptomyces sp. NBC_00090]|uniref:hypothetical protein n=1 Tax=Streptomyces sp. NBC_00090 TaxID=2903619 RepID=UPI00324B17F8
MFLVLAVSAVLTASGCAADPQPSVSSSASSSAPARVARQLTAEELVEAALPVDAVLNLIGNPASVFQPTPDDTKVQYTAGPPACRQMLDAADGRQTPVPAAAIQQFDWKDDGYGGTSVLTSYQGSGAKETFAKVREGLKTCRYFERQGPAGLYKATVTVHPAPRFGDEAVRFEITAPVKLGAHVTEWTVVRTGSTVATFTKLSVAGHDVRAFPPALITEQITRLQTAQG